MARDNWLLNLPHSQPLLLYQRLSVRPSTPWACTTRRPSGKSWISTARSLQYCPGTPATEDLSNSMVGLNQPSSHHFKPYYNKSSPISSQVFFLMLLAFYLSKLFIHTATLLFELYFQAKPFSENFRIINCSEHLIYTLTVFLSVRGFHTFSFIHKSSAHLSHQLINVYHYKLILYLTLHILS